MNKGKVTEMFLLFFKPKVYRLQFLIGLPLSSMPLGCEYKQLLVLEFNQSAFNSYSIWGSLIMDIRFLGSGVTKPT